MRICILVIAFVGMLSCAKKELIITIVDFRENDRIELGKQLRIINKYSPKLIALNVFLCPDSLGIDSIIVKELDKAKNTVQVVGLHNFFEPLDAWDSLDISNSKFKVSATGFANLTTSDSILVGELPMSQSFQNREIFAFSYVIAENTFGVKSKYHNTGHKKIQFKLEQLGKNYKLISKKDLVNGNFKKDDLNGKIVMLGYMGDKEDFFYLDDNKDKKIRGSEIHAALIEELIDH